jgi:hypothetical protein
MRLSLIFIGKFISKAVLSSSKFGFTIGNKLAFPCIP